jgi:predicted  nucleic acid-binding Zn-ribbon protein
MNHPTNYDADDQIAEQVQNGVRSLVQQVKDLRELRGALQHNIEAVLEKKNIVEGERIFWKTHSETKEGELKELKEKWATLQKNTQINEQLREAKLQELTLENKALKAENNELKDEIGPLLEMQRLVGYKYCEKCEQWCISGDASECEECPEEEEVFVEVD